MFCQQLKTRLVGNLLVRYANNLIAHLLEGQRPIIVCLSARDRIMNDRALAFEDNGRMLAGFFPNDIAVYGVLPADAPCVVVERDG